MTWWYGATLIVTITALGSLMGSVLALYKQLCTCRRSLNNLSARYIKRQNEIADLQGILRTTREQRRSRSLPRAKPKST